MRLVCGCLCVLLAAVATVHSAQEPHYLQQKLDHFNPLDNRTFSQKYYFDDEYWNPISGPIFLYISGEGPCSGTPNNYLKEIASSLSGLIVTLEHRYYGESQPFRTLDTANLVYLSSKQAIYDLAYFVEYFNANYKTSHSKWFAVGCSYAGALSAWFRLKFPHLTKGSWSSSGVVNAILEFSAFDKQVSDSAGAECSELLRTVISGYIDQQLQQSTASNAAIKNLFGASPSLFTDDGDFRFLVADIAAESVQYGYQEQLCQTLQQVNRTLGGTTHTLPNPRKDDIALALTKAYANFTKTIYYPNFGDNLGYSTSRQRDVQPPNADRTWMWQTCTELGYFQTAPSLDSIRSRHLTLDYFREHCKNVFDVPVWPNTEDTNMYYGKDNIQATNIVFINSSQDPWRRASVEHTVKSDEPFHLVVCHNCGHCSEMRGCPSLPNQDNLYNCDDSQQNVPKSRALLKHYVQEWLSQ